MVKVEAYGGRKGVSVRRVVAVELCGSYSTSWWDYYFQDLRSGSCTGFNHPAREATGEDGPETSF